MDKITNPKVDSNIPKALIALDQSSTNVGWVVFLDGVFESSGVLKPDPVDYDLLRFWVKDMIGTLKTDGYEVDVAVESIFLKSYPVKDKKTGKMKMQPQAQTFKVLAQIQAHVWASARDMGCKVTEITAFYAMKTLTGINEVATKTEIRKAAMKKHAEEFLGYEVSEHEADALGIALYFLEQQQAIPS